MHLLIFRHAKSGHPASVDDFDRPLCDEGNAAAPLIGSWIREHHLEPAAVLCSSALRTKETLALVLPFFRTPPDVEYERSLYLSGVPALLGKIRKAPALSPLMIVGHNPGLHEMAVALLARQQRGEAKIRAEELARKFPPAGLAVLEFKQREWAGLKPATAQLAYFVRPKVLMKKPDQS
jgi:phosphohistidine phosphatase